MDENLIKVGKYNMEFNKILHIDIAQLFLRSEMVPDALERVPEMMDTPPIQM